MTSPTSNVIKKKIEDSENVTYKQSSAENLPFSLNNTKLTNSNNSNENLRVFKQKGPREIFIHKSDTGFGFNVRGQVSEGGTKF
jgi:hypothetical protein